MEKPTPAGDSMYRTLALADQGKVLRMGAVSPSSRMIGPFSCIKAAWMSSLGRH